MCRVPSYFYKTESLFRIAIKPRPFCLMHASSSAESERYNQAQKLHDLFPFKGFFLAAIYFRFTGILRGKNQSLTVDPCKERVAQCTYV